MNIVSFSGGKDSTAMLIRLVELKEPIHSVLWFDTEREFPEILTHMEKMKNDFPQIKFQRVRHWAGFDFLQERYGGAHKSGGWCTAAKRDVCNQYVRLYYKNDPSVIECIGFTTDEKHRADRIVKAKKKKKPKKKWNVRFPLLEWGMSEADCLQFCYDRGYDFGGIYEWMPSKRVSCYDCPKQSKADWEAIKIHKPELIE